MVSTLPTAMRQQFDQLARRRLHDRQPNLPAHPPAPAPPPPRANPRATRQQHLANTRVAPEEAFSNLRAVIAQPQTLIVAVVDLGDMLTTNPDRYAAEEHNALVLLKKCTLETSVIREGNLTGYHNTIIILASDLKRVPAWFHVNNPTLLESLVECILNRWIFKHYPDLTALKDHTLTLALTPEGTLNIRA